MKKNDTKQKKKTIQFRYGAKNSKLNYENYKNKKWNFADTWTYKNIKKITLKIKWNKVFKKTWDKIKRHFIPWFELVSVLT